jgi:hypothetical protein
MTGQFDVCGDKFILIFQGQPNEEQERLFHSYLTEVWQRVPLAARRAILAKHAMPQIMVETRLMDYQTVRSGGMVAKIAWPIAKAGPDPFLFSCDRLRLFTLPRLSALLILGEELAHGYLKAIKDPTHVNPPPLHEPAFVDFNNAMEARMQDVLCDEWSFDRAEHNRLTEWVRLTDGGLKPQQ